MTSGVKSLLIERFVTVKVADLLFKSVLPSLEANVPPGIVLTCGPPDCEVT